MSGSGCLKEMVRIELFGGSTSIPEQITPAAAIQVSAAALLAPGSSAGPTVSATRIATSRLVRISISALIMLCALASRACACGLSGVAGVNSLCIKDIMHHQLGFRDVERRLHKPNRHRARHPQAHKRQDEPLVPEQGKDGVIRSETRRGVLPIGRLGGLAGFILGLVLCKRCRFSGASTPSRCLPQTRSAPAAVPDTSAGKETPARSAPLPGRSPAQAQESRRPSAGGSAPGNGSRS